MSPNSFFVADLSAAISTEIMFVFTVVVLSNNEGADGTIRARIADLVLGTSVKAGEK